MKAIKVNLIEPGPFEDNDAIVVKRGKKIVFRADYGDRNQNMRMALRYIYTHGFTFRNDTDIVRGFWKRLEAEANDFGVDKFKADPKKSPQQTKYAIASKIQRILIKLYERDGSSIYDTERIIIEDSEVGSTCRIQGKDIEKYCITRDRTRGMILTFICGKDDEEIRYQDVSHNELTVIYTKLYNFWKKL